VTTAGRTSSRNQADSDQDGWCDLCDNAEHSVSSPGRQWTGMDWAMPGDNCVNVYIPTRKIRTANGIERRVRSGISTATESPTIGKPSTSAALPTRCRIWQIPTATSSTTCREYVADTNPTNSAVIFPYRAFSKRRRMGRLFSFVYRPLLRASTCHQSPVAGPMGQWNVRNGQWRYDSFTDTEVSTMRVYRVR